MHVVRDASNERVQSKNSWSKCSSDARSPEGFRSMWLGRVNGSFHLISSARIHSFSAYTPFLTIYLTVTGCRLCDIISITSHHDLHWAAVVAPRENDRCETPPLVPDRIPDAALYTYDLYNIGPELGVRHTKIYKALSGCCSIARIQ